MPTYGNIGFSTSNFYLIVVGDSTFETFMDYPYMWAEISKIKLNIVTLVEQVSTKVLQLVPDVPVNSVNQDFQKIYQTAFWKFDYFVQHREKLSPIPQTNGYIKGTVKVEGLLYEDIPVRLYHRGTGTKIFETTSDENGEYRFDYVCTDIPEYLVCSILDGFETVYNASVLDKVSAVNYNYPVSMGVNTDILPPLDVITDSGWWIDVENLYKYSSIRDELLGLATKMEGSLESGIYVVKSISPINYNGFSVMPNRYSFTFYGYVINRNGKTVIRLCPYKESKINTHELELYGKIYNFYASIKIIDIVDDSFMLVSAEGTYHNLDPELNFPNNYYLIGIKDSQIPAIRLPNDFYAGFQFFFEDGTYWYCSTSDVPSSGTVYTKLAYKKFIMRFSMSLEANFNTLTPSLGGYYTYQYSVRPCPADMEIYDYFIQRDEGSSAWGDEIIISTMAWKTDMVTASLSNNYAENFLNSPPTKEDTNPSYASLYENIQVCVLSGVTFKTSCLESRIFVPVQRRLRRNANTYVAFIVSGDFTLGLFRHKKGKDIIPLNDYFPGGPASDSFWDDDILVYGYRGSDGALMVNKYIYPGVFPTFVPGVNIFKIAYNINTGMVFIGTGSTWFNGGDPINLLNPAFTIKLMDANHSIYPFIQTSVKDDSDYAGIYSQTTPPAGYLAYTSYGPQNI